MKYKKEQMYSLNMVENIIRNRKVPWMFSKFFNYTEANEVSRKFAFNVIGKLFKMYKVLPDKIKFLKEGGISIIYKYKNYVYSINCYNDNEYSEEIRNTYLEHIEYYVGKHKEINSMFIHKHFFKKMV